MHDHKYMYVLTLRKPDTFDLVYNTDLQNSKCTKDLATHYNVAPSRSNVTDAAFYVHDWHLCQSNEYSVIMHINSIY